MHCDKEGHSHFAALPISQEIDGLNMKIGRIKQLTNTHFHFSSLQIGKCALEGFSSSAIDSARHAEIASSGGYAHLESVEADFAIIRDERSIDATWCQWII